MSVLNIVTVIDGPLLLSINLDVRDLLFYVLASSENVFNGILCDVLKILVVFTIFVVAHICDLVLYKGSNSQGLCNTRAHS